MIFPSQPPGLYSNYIEMDGSAIAGGAQYIKYHVSEKHSAWDSKFKMLKHDDISMYNGQC